MVDLLIYLLMWLEMLIEIMLTSTSWSMMTNIIQNNALERENFGQPLFISLA